MTRSINGAVGEIRGYTDREQRGKEMMADGTLSRLSDQGHQAVEARGGGRR